MTYVETIPQKIRTFSAVDAAARAALVGMSVEDLCYQEDTSVLYRFDGSAWVAITDLVSYPHWQISIGAPSSVGQGVWTDGYSSTYRAWVLGSSSEADGDNVSFTLWLPAGTYDMSLAVTVASERGVLDIDLNGVEKGSKDCYSAGSDQVGYEIDNLVIAAMGAQVFRFRVDGKHASGSGYAMIIFNIEIGRKS